MDSLLLLISCIRSVKEIWKENIGPIFRLGLINRLKVAKRYISLCEKYNTIVKCAHVSHL